MAAVGSSLGDVELELALGLVDARAAPSTNTSVPSAGGFPARAASRFHMQQRTWLLASRRLKYQWPLGHALQPTHLAPDPERREAALHDPLDGAGELA